MSTQLARNVVNGFHRQPALLAVAYADVLTDTIRHLATANERDEDDSASRNRENLISTYGFEKSVQDKPFAFSNGIAIIPVTGLLINRFNSAWGWVTGYNAIRNQFNAALEDSDVKGIVFDCNSGGGQVAGCFELCNDIYNARGIKPSVAIVDAAAYSAAYAIASSAGKIVATPSGGVGSVGVVAMHIDFSQMLKDAGIKVTFIYSGDHKVDGNPYQPLSGQVKADIQKSVDATRKEFVDLVARNRGLESKVVFDTQAQCYSASDALELGLIDAIATPNVAVKALFNELSGSTTQMETVTMTTSAAKPGAESTATTPENTTPAAAPVASAAAPVDTTAERNAERARIKAITTHEAAKDKPVLANHLALNTDMSVEAAAEILAAAAPEKAEPAAGKPNAFSSAMDSGQHPEVGAGDKGADLSPAQRILQSQAAATGESVTTH